MKRTWHNPSSRQLKRRASELESLRYPADLAELLKTAQPQLELLKAKPPYRVYHIPKKDGSSRLIEDPRKPLKKVLRNLNYYLQAVYHANRPDAVYGFCISANDETDRNIVSNAKRHLGAHYMLNVDMEDFFHSIGRQRVKKLWQQQFSDHHESLAELVAGLATYRKRLPMGAPTSPVLSNFACLELDAELQGYADGSGIVYSRFADDLSFSSDKPLKGEVEQFIREAISRSGFLLNEEKVKHFDPGHTKIVTGLIVEEDTINLPKEYTSQLKNELARLEAVMLVEKRYQTGMSFRKLKLLKQELQGKINFAAMVLGDDHLTVEQLYNRYENAVNPPEDLSLNWLDIPYTF